MLLATLILFTLKPILVGANVRVRLSMLCLIASIVAAQTVQAVSTTRIMTKDGKAVQIAAESMFGDYERQTVNLVGNVQLSFDSQVLRSDRVIVDKKLGRFIAEGNVVIASPTAYVEGSRAEISYEDNTGLIHDGFVKSGQVLFQGTVIRKTGPETYVAENASYTACTTCPPAWSFTGSYIDAEIGAYAHIKSAWFYLGGFRFFWLPYLIVPLKSERQSGLLFPTFEFQRESIGLALPFFWAISRSQDLTITPKFFVASPDSKTPTRDPKFLFNYRSVFNDDSFGETNFAFGNDNIFASDKNLPNLPGSGRSNRWFFSHEHIYSLPGGFINRSNFGLVSDLRYSRDFPEEIKGLGDPALENRISLTRNTHSVHSSIEAAYYVNQLKADPLEGNSESVHRFPEIRYSGVDRSLMSSRLFLRWDFNYVNFVREDFSYDDVIITPGSTPRKIDRTRGSGGIGSGIYNPDTDQIRTGQRLDLRPELSAPVRIGKYLDLLPTIQFRHTQYSFNASAPPGVLYDAMPTRQYIRGRVALRTQLSRVYDLKNDTGTSSTAPDESESPANSELLANNEAAQTGIFQTLNPPLVTVQPEKIKHEIEPEISISGIPWLHQTDSTFFGESSLSPIYVEGQPVSDSDFYSNTRLQFDYEDRITSRNIISAQVLNRVVKKSWSGEEPTYRQIVLVKNGMSYEFDKPNRNANSNFSDFYTTLDARFSNFDTNTSIRYFPLHRVFNTSSRAAIRDINGNYFQLSFSQNFRITEVIEEAYEKREENIGLALGYVHRYAKISGELNYLPSAYSPIDFRLKSWSTMLDLRPPGDCWGLRLSISHILSEERPRFTFGFDYKFGGMN
jgi:LPS-assembly protein